MFNEINIILNTGVCKNLMDIQARCACTIWIGHINIFTTSGVMLIVQSHTDTSVKWIHLNLKSKGCNRLRT